MILTCPECSTRYEADPAKFQPAGRTVRCAKCGHVWHQSAPAIAEDAAADADEISLGEAAQKPDTGESPPAESVAATPAGEAARESPLPGRLWKVGAISGWIGFVVLVAVLVWAGIRFRTQIVTLWPQTASFYNTVGLDVNVVGLAFQDVRYRVTIEDDLPVLLIKARIVNISKTDLFVPKVHVSLVNAYHHEVYGWTVDPAVKTMKPGQSVAIHTRLPSPPSGARHLELTFVTAKT